MFTFRSILAGMLCALLWFVGPVWVMFFIVFALFSLYCLFNGNFMSFCLWSVGVALWKYCPLLSIFTLSLIVWFGFGVVVDENYENQKEEKPLISCTYENSTAGSANTYGPKTASSFKQHMGFAIGQSKPYYPSTSASQLENDSIFATVRPKKWHMQNPVRLLSPLFPSMVTNTNSVKNEQANSRDYNVNTDSLTRYITGFNALIKDINEVDYIIRNFNKVSVCDSSQNDGIWSSICLNTSNFFNFGGDSSSLRACTCFGTGKSHLGSCSCLGHTCSGVSCACRRLCYSSDTFFTYQSHFGFYVRRIYGSLGYYRIVEAVSSWISTYAYSSHENTMEWTSDAPQMAPIWLSPNTTVTNMRTNISATNDAKAIIKNNNTIAEKFLKQQYYTMYRDGGNQDNYGFPKVVPPVLTNEEVGDLLSHMMNSNLTLANHGDNHGDNTELTISYNESLPLVSIDDISKYASKQPLSVSENSVHFSNCSVTNSNNSVATTIPYIESDASSTILHRC